MKRILVGGCAALLMMACSDDPSIYLGGPAGPAARIQLSAGDFDLKVGQSVTVGASVLDAVGNVTGDTPSFAACGAPVTVASATGDGLFSAAATITASAGTVGASCVLVTAAGLTDTVHVDVGPAGLQIAGPDTIGSGETTAFTANGFDAAGAATTGTPPLEWTSSSQTRMITEFDVGEATGRSPGAVTLRVRAPGGATATKSLVVAPGTFAGTLSANSGAAGLQITATKGAADDAFDDNTLVTVGGQAAYIEIASPSSMIVAMPATGVAGARNMDFLNLGPNQTAKRVSVTTTSAFDDQYGSNTDGPGSAPSFVSNSSPGGYVYFTHSGFGTGSAARGQWNSGNPASPADHYFRFTAATSGTVTALLEWTNGGGSADFDLEICRWDGLVQSGCQFWISGSSTVEQGTAYTVTAGTTYTVMASAWTANNNIHNLRLSLTTGGGATIN